MSISNRLEETEKTERPWRTQSIQTDLSHAVAPFSQGLHSDAEMQGLRRSREPPSWVSALFPFCTFGSSADPTSSSMGIHTYSHMVQMTLGTELKRVGWGFALAVNGGSSERVPSGIAKMVKLDIFLNRGVFAMLSVIVLNTGEDRRFFMCRIG